MKTKKDIQVSAKTIDNVSAVGGFLSIDLADCDTQSIIDNYHLEDLIEFIGDDNILHKIGVDRVMEYFDLQKTIQP